MIFATCSLKHKQRKLRTRHIPQAGCEPPVWRTAACEPPVWRTAANWVMLLLLVGKDFNGKSTGRLERETHRLAAMDNPTNLMRRWILSQRMPPPTPNSSLLLDHAVALETSPPNGTSPLSSKESHTCGGFLAFKSPLLHRKYFRVLQGKELQYKWRKDNETHSWSACLG